MVKAVVKQWTFVTTSIDPILGEIMTVGIDYHIADGTTNEERTQANFTISPLDTPAQVRQAASAAIVADAAVGGYTITGTDIRFQDGIQGV